LKAIKFNNVARISGNPAVKGASGMVNGTLVYRKFQDGMILAGAPEKSTKAPSAKQMEHRERFQLANFYAFRAKNNPDLLQLYQEGAVRHEYPNVHSFIIADYFRTPKILEYAVGGDKKRSEDWIDVVVVDLIAAKSVTLQFQTPDGSILESVSPTVMADGQTWRYLLADPLVLAAGNQLVVKAIDHPGHEVTQTFVL